MRDIRINLNAIPPEEQDAAKFIELNLVHMRSASSEFGYSVELFLHIRSLVRGGLDVWRKMAWSRIVGRNGAINAYAFAMAMQTINKSKCPGIWSLIDMDARKLGQDLFKAEFPSIEGIRNAAAHPGELSGKKNELEYHKLKEPMLAQGNAFFGIGSLVESHIAAGDQTLTLTASFGGRSVSYVLSADKAAALEKAGDIYSSAFQPISL